MCKDHIQQLQEVRDCALKASIDDATLKKKKESRDQIQSKAVS